MKKKTLNYKDEKKMQIMDMKKMCPIMVINMIGENLLLFFKQKK